MARFRFYLLTAVFCTVIVLGQTNDVTTERLATVPVTPKVTEAAAPTTSEVTENKDETSPDTSTHPVPPTTTTTTPATTTSTTTTTPETTSSTTTTSTTTTTAAPPTTPAPGPAPAPQQGTWSFTDAANITCVIVQFAAQLDITYPKIVNTTTELDHKILNVPVNASADGGCGADSQWLRLFWSDPAAPEATNFLSLVFAANATTKTYELSALNATLAQALFPNATEDLVLTHGADWQTPLATSYRCEPATALPLASDAPNVAGNLTLSHLHEEAFRTAHGTAFSAARECGGGDVPDAVPIAVGCALGALVLVVLVAYLVARRRSAARGYLSM